MSAHAYIQYADVPQSLIDTSRQHIDGVTGAKVIAFEGCPFAGQIESDGDALEVEFPFPRNAELRDSFVAWLMNWGISFMVAM